MQLGDLHILAAAHTGRQQLPRQVMTHVQSLLGVSYHNCYVHSRPVQHKAIRGVVAHMWVLIRHRHTVQQDDKEHAVVKVLGGDNVIQLDSDGIRVTEQPETGAGQIRVTAGPGAADSTPIACTAGMRWPPSAVNLSAGFWSQ